jgi:hypothetical protein
MQDSVNTKSFLPHNKSIVTFRDLQKVLQSQPDYYSSQQSEMLDRLRGKPFWYWNNGRHNEVTRSSKYDCCFNHIVGLPTKDGIEKPMFDYERDIYFGLQKPYYLNSYSSTDQFHIKSNNILFPFKAKHLWIKKATGLGATEFMLRFMAWLCVHNDDYQNSQMVIVTGPNIDLAIKLIRE